MPLTPSDAGRGLRPLGFGTLKRSGSAIRLASSEGAHEFA